MYKDNDQGIKYRIVFTSSYIENHLIGNGISISKEVRKL